MRVSKKTRRIAADLCAAAACLCLVGNRIVMIGELIEAFWANESLDLWGQDQVALLAALAFREAQSDEEDPILRWAETYAEAEAMLREGFTPKGDG